MLISRREVCEYYLCSKCHRYFNYQFTSIVFKYRTCSSRTPLLRAFEYKKERKNDEGKRMSLEEMHFCDHTKYQEHTDNDTFTHSDIHDYFGSVVNLIDAMSVEAALTSRRIFSSPAGGNRSSHKAALGTCFSMRIHVSNIWGSILNN